MFKVLEAATDRMYSKNVLSEMERMIENKCLKVLVLSLPLLLLFKLKIDNMRLKSHPYPIILDKYRFR